VVCYEIQQFMFKHDPVKPFGIYRRQSVWAALLTQDAPHTTIAVTGHITDDIKDIRQYFSACLVIKPVATPVLPVGSMHRLHTESSYVAFAYLKVIN
jgi:hypothetical protein